MRRAAAVLMVLALAGCGSDGPSGPTLKALDDGSVVGSEQPDTPIGTSVLLPLRPLCTTGAPISVTGLELRDATGGLRIATWGTRLVRAGEDVDNGVAGAPGRADRLPGFGHHRVRVRCGSDDVMQFSVSLVATSSRATATGVDLSYGDGRKVFVQYGVAVCSTAACAPAGT